MHSASRPVQEQRVLGASSAVTGDAASASASALESMCGRVSRDSERSVGVPNGGDEEGLGLLRQQLSAVKRIRMEHERKDAAIAALRLEVRSGNEPHKVDIHVMALLISCSTYPLNEQRTGNCQGRTTLYTV